MTKTQMISASLLAMIAIVSMTSATANLQTPDLRLGDYCEDVDRGWKWNRTSCSVSCAAGDKMHVFGAVDEIGPVFGEAECGATAVAECVTDANNPIYCRGTGVTPSEIDDTNGACWVKGYGGKYTRLTLQCWGDYGSSKDLKLNGLVNLELDSDNDNSRAAFFEENSIRGVSQIVMSNGAAEGIVCGSDGSCEATPVTCISAAGIDACGIRLF